MGDDHRSDHETALLELAAQTQHVHVVGDAEILTNLVLLDILCADHYNYLRAVLKLTEHLQLDIGLEARQHAACVMIVK